jgi:peptidyl-prolyl cis-trans isomerase B (cyclophilin B)
MTLQKDASRLLAAAGAIALGAALAIPAAAQTKKSASRRKETKVTKPRDYAHTLAILKTSQGDITVKFFYDKAPNHVKNFIDLSAKGFYNGTLFHRVIPGFMVQGGDPLTKDPANAAVYGTGGNKDAQGNPVNLKAEFNDVSHRRGILSMARASDPNSASSQFFLVVKDSPFLDRQYTAFGEIVNGLDVADKIVAESNTDPASGGRGVPRNYQKLLKVELIEEPPAAAPAKN